VELQYHELENGIRLIRLAGRLDIAGAGEIETRLTESCAGDNTRVVIDLSAVDFLASSGIRLLTLTAQSVVRHGGRIVLLNPSPEVHHVLEVTGIPSVMPIHSRMEAAEAALLA
jgi:anti-anti-sigma factor